MWPLARLSVRANRVSHLRAHQALLRVALLLNIDVDAIPARDSAVFSMLRDTADQEPTIGSVRTADARLHLEWVAARQSRLPFTAELGIVFRMQCIEQRLILQSPRWPAM